MTLTIQFQAQNSDYFSQYLTEDIHDYIARKRYLGVHGNHLEIQALSEMYNRPIHIYCYSAEPINTFQVQSTKVNFLFLQWVDQFESSACFGYCENITEA